MNLAGPLVALLQILIIDLSLAADNAVVIGMAAAGLPAPLRRRAVWAGLGAATVLRIALAFFAVRLLHVAGLAAAGGLLLLWVAWKMFRDLRRLRGAPAGERRLRDESEDSPLARRGEPDRSFSAEESQTRKLPAAILQILLADLGMSLDNILAVAGAARDHYAVLAFGLFLSVALMGLAATATAKMLHRFPWIGWLGVATVLFVAMKMIAEGIAGVF